MFTIILLPKKAEMIFFYIMECQNTFHILQTVIKPTKYPH